MHCLKSPFLQKYEYTVIFRTVNILLRFTMIPYVFHSILSFLFYLVATKTLPAGGTIKNFFAERKKVNLVKFNHLVGLTL